MNKVTFNNNHSYYPIPPSSRKSKLDILVDFKKVVHSLRENTKNWHERTIAYLDKKEFELEEIMPNHSLQDKIDHLGAAIKAHFAPLKTFNRWLNNNGEGDWYKQIATFLVKLPLRAIRNIVHLLYNIIKGAIFAVVHPLKAINHLAKLIVTLIHELSKPETWSKLGIGIVGGSLGQALVTGNPLSVMGFGIGISFLIGGLSIGALKAALSAEKGSKFDAVKKNLIFQGKQLPESAMTGFFMGLIMGGIQRTVHENQGNLSYKEAKHTADSLIKEHNLPKYSKVEVDPTGKIIIKWDGSQLHNFKRLHPQLFNNKISYGHLEFPEAVTMELNAEGGRVITHMNVGDMSFQEGYTYMRSSSLESLGIGGRVYPLPQENIQLSRLGAPLGGAAAFKNKIKTN